MSEIEDALQAAGETVGHVPEAALAVAVAFGAKKAFGPSLDVIGSRMADLTNFAINNLVKTFQKAEALTPAEKADWYPHPRTALKVLNDACLYDDDVMQTYVAGLIAGSRNADGSDDRPVYYLTLIDGLTAYQLRCFHALYAAFAAVGESRDGAVFSDMKIDVNEFGENLEKLDAHEGVQAQNVVAGLLAIEASGLIDNLRIGQTDDEVWELKFKPTRLGGLLFDWAHGFGDEDIRSFPREHYPDVGLPRLEFAGAALNE